MIAKGKVFKYGDNIDTDVIIPARYLNAPDPKELAQYCMIDIDTSFAKEVEKGDIIVAEKNFGCGSSREHAPLSIKYTGASCVIAKSFARIFYRNSFNIGLPILECSEAVDNIDAGDQVQVNFETGEIVNITKNMTFKAAAFPEFISQIIQSDGLVGYVKSRLEKSDEV